MNKAITIEGKEVMLAIDASIICVYQAYMGRPLLEDFNRFQKKAFSVYGDLDKKDKMEKLEQLGKKAEEGDLAGLAKDIDDEMLETLTSDSVDMSFAVDLLWVMAKMADDNVPLMEQWLKQFAGWDSIVTAAGEAFSMFQESMRTVVSPKNSKAGAKKLRVRDFFSRLKK